MDAFVGEAGQFGDPTMLRPECYGPQPQQAPPFALALQRSRQTL